MTTLREKSRISAIKQLKPVVHVLKTWFLEVGYNYMKTRPFKEEEEALIDDITDFYLECIKKIEKF